MVLINISELASKQNTGQVEADQVPIPKFQAGSHKLALQYSSPLFRICPLMLLLRMVSEAPYISIHLRTYRTCIPLTQMFHIVMSQNIYLLGVRCITFRAHVYCSTFVIHSAFYLALQGVFYLWK